MPGEHHACFARRSFKPPAQSVSFDAKRGWLASQAPGGVFGQVISLSYSKPYTLNPTT